MYVCMYVCRSMYIRPVLGYINIGFCVQILILQRFSRSTRFSYFCTAQISKFQRKPVQIFAGMKMKFHFSFAFFDEICDFSAKIWWNFAAISQKCSGNDKKVDTPYSLKEKGKFKVFESFEKIKVWKKWVWVGLAAFPAAQRGVRRTEGRASTLPAGIPACATPATSRWTLRTWQAGRSERRVRASLQYRKRDLLLAVQA